MKTKSFTPEQRVEVDRVICTLVITVCNTINEAAIKIAAMDKRPRRVWSEAEPEVFFPYVGQAMLEEIIDDLQERV